MKVLQNYKILLACRLGMSKPIKSLQAIFEALFLIPYMLSNRNIVPLRPLTIKFNKKTLRLDAANDIDKISFSEQEMLPLIWCIKRA